LIILDGWHVKLDSIEKRRHLPNCLHNIEFYNPIEAFSKIWDKMPPGSFVISRDCFASVYFEKYYGTSHAYTGMVWEYLLDKFKLKGDIYIKCISEPVILFRIIEKSWRLSAMQIIYYEIPEWFLRLPKEYQEVVSPILRKYLSELTKFTTLLRYRATGQLNSKSIKNFMIAFSDKQIRKALIIASVPISIVKLAGKVRKILKTIK
jgi:hypothetical protein